MKFKYVASTASGCQLHKTGFPQALEIMEFCVSDSLFSGYWWFQAKLFQNACMVYKHAYSKTLLLLHPAFMPSVVKMPLKGKAGGCALNCHGNDHGIPWKKSWDCVFEFLMEL